MSWKATAFVKDLHDGITPSEKLLLFVLADYHNTVRRIAWPSLPTLAYEAMMSERQARRLISSLEVKGVLQIIRSAGGHETSFYRFSQLDEGGQDVPPDLPREDIREDKSALQGGQIETPNKERTGEPVKEEPVTTYKTFQKPTLQEVTDYCQERRNSVDPQKWLDYYSANGWKVGRNSMKDWKASVRLWERNDNGGSRAKPETFGQLAVGNTRRAAEAFLARDGISLATGTPINVQPRTNGGRLSDVEKTAWLLPLKGD